MKMVFTSLFFNSLAFISIAQNNLPPVYEIKTDTVEYLHLKDSDWQMLEDKTGKFTINQVSQPPLTNKFHANTVPTKGFDFSINAYWFRYRIKNIMTHNAGISLPEAAAYADVYTPKATGVWEHKKTGFAIPWIQRDGLKKIRQITYTLQPREELLVYERDNFAYSTLKLPNI